MRYLSLYTACVFLTLSSIHADSQSHVKYGLAPLKEHEVNHLENNVHKVIEVSLNDLGFDRLQAHAEKYAIDIPEKNENSQEFQTAQISSSNAHQMLVENCPLPSAVDNSKLPSFPPIGNQGSLGSCVAWGSTYYQASHEIGLLHGWNNKTSSAHVLSPKWTYNLINQGKNVGSSPVVAYELLSMNGAPTILDFPYDNNYTAWDLNTDHWVSALSNRMAPATLIPGLGGAEEQNLTAIKQALVNGHVLTFASFIDSWVYTRIKFDPGSPNSSHVGEYAAYWMNGYNGGHFMTIVGYDDNIWIDINQNGSVDPGEKGAFLIANSWGTDWGNHGFIWISYDAFLAHSRVSGGPGQNRVPAGMFFNSCLISATAKEPNYTPRLIAEFSISQAYRNQINIQAGVSALNQALPTSYITIPAFANKGGDFEFDGAPASNVAETATFAIDLTDFLSSFPSPQRYYLLVGDNTPGNRTTLNSFSLLDLTNKRTVNNSVFSLPKSYDNETGHLYIDY